MSIQFGNNKIKNVYYGGDKIKEIYHGTELVYKSGSGIKGWCGKQSTLNIHLFEYWIGPGEYAAPGNTELIIPRGHTITAIQGTLGQSGSSITVSGAGYSFNSVDTLYGSTIYKYASGGTIVCCFEGSNIGSSVFTIYTSPPPSLSIQPTLWSWVRKSGLFSITVNFYRQYDRDTDDFVSACIDGSVGQE